MEAININTTPVSRKFNDNVIELYPDKEHEFLMTTKQAVDGYGCSESTLRSAKKEHSDELVEGKHFIITTVRNSDARKDLRCKRMYWTKRGIVRLGFFIRSERAKQFRDWAEDLIVDTLEKKPGRKALGKGLELEETPAVPALQIPKGLQIMTVPSDSMSSEYHVGETIFFDPRKTKGDGVFVIRIGNMVDIRRIQYFIDRNLIGLKRSNPLYRDVDLFEPSTPHLTILGMVVGKIQRGYM